MRLTAYILDDSVEMLNGGKKGAILICPGGGYLYCSDREGEPVAMAFAAMGYHTFVLRYSVYNENKEGEFLPDFPRHVKTVGGKTEREIPRAGQGRWQGDALHQGACNGLAYRHGKGGLVRIFGGWAQLPDVLHLL